MEEFHSTVGDNNSKQHHFESETDNKKVRPEMLGGSDTDSIAGIFEEKDGAEVIHATQQRCLSCRIQYSDTFASLDGMSLRDVFDSWAVVNASVPFFYSEVHSKVPLMSSSKGTNSVPSCESRWAGIFLCSSPDCCCSDAEEMGKSPRKHWMSVSDCSRKADVGIGQGGLGFNPLLSNLPPPLTPSSSKLFHFQFALPPWSPRDLRGTPGGLRAGGGGGLRGVSRGSPGRGRSEGLGSKGEESEEWGPKGVGNEGWGARGLWA